MLLHLEAISDEMIVVLENGTIIIQQVTISNGHDKNPEDSDSEIVTTGQKIYRDKPREIWTSKDSKRFRLDRIARNIIIRSTPGFIQCKLWGSKTAKVAWKLIEEIFAGTEETKENKFEVSTLKFQNFKQGPLDSLEELDF